MEKIVECIAGLVDDAVRCVVEGTIPVCNRILSIDTEKAESGKTQCTSRIVFCRNKFHWKVYFFLCVCWKTDLCQQES